MAVNGMHCHNRRKNSRLSLCLIRVKRTGKARSGRHTHVRMKLEELRKTLSDLDRDIIRLVGERQRLVGDIGRVKQSAGAGTRDFAREKEVLDLARAHAEEFGVDPALAENLLSDLIRSSLASQERDRVISEGKGGGRSALVIGEHNARFLDIVHRHKQSAA